MPDGQSHSHKPSFDRSREKTPALGMAGVRRA